MRGDQPAIALGAGHLLLALASTLRCQWLHADVLT